MPFKEWRRIRLAGHRPKECHRRMRVAGYADQRDDQASGQPGTGELH